MNRKIEFQVQVGNSRGAWKGLETIIAQSTPKSNSYTTPSDKRKAFSDE